VDSVVDIATALTASRKRQKLTQLDLARAAHVSLSTLKALESHRGDEIGFTKLTRLLAVLGLELKLQAIAPRRPTLEELLAEEADENAQPEVEP
jgi:transcriptional regulator with XRE-family HTH domain